MKTKTTKNQLKKYYNNIISVGYCDLQNLLSCEDPQFYNSGVCGWNYDAYVIGTACICTGYRQIPGHAAPYEIVEAYEAKAKEIKQNSRDYTATKAALYDLLMSFIKEVSDTVN